MSNEAALYELHQTYIEEFKAVAAKRIPTGYGVPDAERQAALQNWVVVHPEYKVPSDKTRDVARERMRIKSYLDREFEASPTYGKFIASLADLPNVAQMSDECRISVNFPAFMEGARIYETLSAYIQQVDQTGVPMDPNHWEINIFSDSTIDKPFDNSEAEVRRFIQDNKHRTDIPKINFIQTKVASPFNNIGHARKVLTDLSLYRSLRRSNQQAPLYIESEDMDIDRADPRVLSNAIAMLDAHPELDFVKGIEDRNPDVMKHNDYLFFRNRVWDFIMVLLRSKKYQDFNDPHYSFGWNRMVSGGWCTAYSAEAYAISGGHDPFAKTGEDTGLAENLSIFRSENENPKLEVGAHITSRSDSTPRRFLYEMISGKNAYAPDNFDHPETNARIRSMSITELLEAAKPLSRLNADNQVHFNKVLMKQVVRASEKVPEKEFKGFVKTLFWMLGFKPDDYVFTEDPKTPFEIKNWQNVADCLEDYRARHPRDRKPGERIKHKNI